MAGHQHLAVITDIIKYLLKYLLTICVCIYICLHNTHTHIYLLFHQLLMPFFADSWSVHHSLIVFEYSLRMCIVDFCAVWTTNLHIFHLYVNFIFVLRLFLDISIFSHVNLLIFPLGFWVLCLAQGSLTYFLFNHEQKTSWLYTFMK